MNRIYKVIWSKVKNCYVVVSEIAKRNSKSTVNSGFSVTRNILAGAVVLGLTAGVCAPVWADNYNTGTPSNDAGNVGNVYKGSIITAYNSTMNAANNNGYLIAFGYNLSGDAKNSILIGNSVTSGGGGEKQILIGYGIAGSSYKNVVVMGHNLKANASNTVTIGGIDTITDAEKAIAIGFSSKANASAIAIGDTAIADKNNAIAIGTSATSNSDGIAERNHHKPSRNYQSRIPSHFTVGEGYI